MAEDFVAISTCLSIICSIICGVIKPKRKMAGIEVERSIIVDSSPYLVLVSESITNTFSLLKPAFTCLCEVGLKYPD